MGRRFSQGNPSMKTASSNKLKPSQELKLEKKKKRKHRKARQEVGEEERNGEVIFGRQLKDGSTSLAILSPGEGIIPGTERDRPVSLGTLIGRVKYGSSSLQGFREDKRNVVKPLYPLNYNMSFSSFGPVYDSTFANMTVEESRLVEACDRFLERADHKDVIRNVCHLGDYYTSTFVDHIIDIFEGREYKDEAMTDEGDNSDNSNSSISCSAGGAEVSSMGDVDFESLKSLSEDGIDMSFLDSLQTHYETKVIDAGPRDPESVESRLQFTANLLGNLHASQNSRLSEAPPLNLSQIAQPGEREAKLAEKVVENLTSLIQISAQPGQVITINSLRKAMGVQVPEEEPKESPPPDTPPVEIL